VDVVLTRLPPKRCDKWATVGKIRSKTQGSTDRRLDRYPLANTGFFRNPAAASAVRQTEKRQRPGRDDLPPDVEMVHRPVAGAGGEALRGSNCGADIRLSLAGGGNEIEALGEPGGDRGRQRAAGAVCVAGGDALAGETGVGGARRQQDVDALATMAV